MRLWGLLAGCALLMACEPAATIEGNGPPSSTSVRVVEYEIGGTAGLVSVTLETPSGTQQVTVEPPYRTSFRFRPGAFVYASVQNETEAGGVTCRIRVGDVEIADIRSSGAYAIASCDGVV